MGWPHIILFACILSLSSCEKHPGFTKTDNGLFIRLDKFGECNPMVKDAAYSILDVTIQSDDEKQDSLFSSLVYLGKLKEPYTDQKDISKRVFEQMKTLHCGDEVTWLLPFEDIDSTYFSGYNQLKLSSDAQLEIKLVVRQTFDRAGYVNYLQQAAQSAEITEQEAINMIFVDIEDHPIEQHGDVFIEKIVVTDGDSIKVGNDITINYTTCLLNGTKLDPLSSMSFPFGRPGQLVPGLTYGLSFMKRGERALIYMPSYLAFGEKGSTTGIVPRNTPVYFDVSIIDVK